MKSDSIILCRDCRHFQDNMEPSQCLAGGNAKDPDYVNGGIVYNWKCAQHVRTDKALCGHNAKWFVPRDPQPVEQQKAA